MTELLPCPFCGGKFKMSQEPNDNGYVAGKYYIYHEHGPVGSNARECIIDIRRHFDSEHDAISAWNTRATTPTASELVEALRNIREKASQGMSHGLTADATCEDIMRLTDAALSREGVKP